jgi:hypothetical protein
MGTLADLLRIGHELESEGFQVGENPVFGGVAPVHVSGSAHYTGDALDINYDGHGQAAETAKLNSIIGRVKAAGLRIIWQTMEFGNHFTHMHVDDKPGPDIGNFTAPATTSTPAPSDAPATAEPAVLGLSLDEMGTTATKAIIISLAVLAGSGLVLLGAGKAAGRTVRNTLT